MNVAEVEATPELQSGHVKWYKVAKNYGFLVADSGREVFVHHSSLIYSGFGKCDHGRGVCVRALWLLDEEHQAELRERFTTVRFEELLVGARVRFRIIEDPRGPQARNVRRA